MLYFLWAIALVAALYLYYRKAYSYFSSRGMKTLRPIPPFGNLTRTVLKMEHFIEQIENLYFSFPGQRIVGNYEFTTPTVVIRDLELIKKIAIKDFDFFHDHRTLIDDASNELVTRNLLSLKGQEWKEMRSALSPAFTSSKIRLMVPFMVEAGDCMINSLKAKIQASETGSVDIDAKDLSTRYANDVIASCAFGLKVDSHKEKYNEFYTMGLETTNFSFSKLLFVLIYLLFPKLMKTFKFSFLNLKYKEYFRNLVLGTMRDREEKNIFRPDMIHLLMEAKKGRLTHDEKNANDLDTGFATVEESNEGRRKINREWSDDDLVAQGILFLLAGFETVSTVMSFLLHELATNPDVQDRLLEEIKENQYKNNGKFDYKSIQSMTYLDMVVSEVLRLWPPAAALERVCVKDYNSGKPNSESKKDFIIPKGTGVGIPVWAIHRDPEFFSNPSKFDPERFSEENKHTIKPFTYMPFGLGPRNCIGSRFALCEVKVMVYQLLQNMELSPCEKTCISSQLATDTTFGSIKLKGGNWVKCRIRYD